MTLRRTARCSIAVTVPLRDNIAISTELLLVLDARPRDRGHRRHVVGAVAAVFASLLVNWYFVPPYNTLTIAEVENMIALAVFVGVAVTVGSLVVVASRALVEARRARVEAEALAGRRPASPPIPTRCPRCSSTCGRRSG